MDLHEQIERVAALNDLPLTYDLSERELKGRYLDLIAEGVVPDEAARNLNRTGRWFRGFRSEKSERFDPDFSERFEEIMRPDGEHRAAVVATARAALIQAAKDGNVRAIEKILMAYDPDFEFLRPAAFSGDTYNVDKLVQIMPSIPTPLLEQVREALVAHKELPVIEA